VHVRRKLLHISFIPVARQKVSTISSFFGCSRSNLDARRQQSCLMLGMMVSVWYEVGLMSFCELQNRVTYKTAIGSQASKNSRAEYEVCDVFSSARCCERNHRAFSICSGTIIMHAILLWMVFLVRPDSAQLAYLFLPTACTSSNW
jgi:hypothetical protein